MSIAASEVTSPMTLLTTLPSVLVTAVWAPTTSLLSRDVIAPVGVRVKKAIGIRITLREQRRSQVVDQRLADVRAAPALQHVEPGVGDGGGDAEHGQPGDHRAVRVGDRRVDDRPDDERRDEGEQGGDEDAEDVHGEESAVRAGERPDPPQRRPRQVDPFDRRRVLRHQPVRPINRT